MTFMLWRRCCGCGLLMGIMLSMLFLPSVVRAEDNAEDEKPEKQERIDTYTTAVDMREVDFVVNKAVKYLEEACHEEWFWEKGKAEPTKGPAHSEVLDGQYTGRTALVALAMLSAGKKPNDKLMSKSIDFLLRTRSYGVYAIGFRAQLWAALPPQERVRKVARWECTQLLNALKRQGDERGYWGYGMGVRAGSRGDHSVSQYGVLAAWAYGKMGFNIPPGAWRDIEEAWQKHQLEEGGWTYLRTPQRSWTKPTMPMTAAGVASLFICMDQLSHTQVRCDGNVIDEHTIRGLGWISKRYEKVNADDLYSMYAIERVGVASGYKYFNGIDWYDRGARQLIKAQLKDASWEGKQWGHDPISDTALAILFLTRGRAPIMMNKLQFRVGEEAGPWTQRPRDVANIVRWTSDKTEQLLNWQVVALDGDPLDLHDAPILYMSGTDAVKLNDRHEKILREYIDAGGLLLVNADCGDTAFVNAMKAMGERFYPDYKFRELPKEHLIYTGQQFKVGSWKNVPKLLGLSNGIRELIVIIPSDDLGGAWQSRRDIGTNKPKFELAANIFHYTVSKTEVRQRGEQHFVRKRPTARSGNKIRLARLKHSGNWNPEPGGWTRLRSLMLNRGLADLTVETVDFTDKPLNPRKYPVVHLTGMGELKIQMSQILALQKYIQDGGSVIVDAAGGDEAFAKSVETALVRVLPDSRLHIIDNKFVAYVKWQNTQLASWRSFAKRKYGILQKPQVRGMKWNGRYAVFFSPQDLSAGMVGQPVDGVMGYAPKYATNLMQNLVLYAAADPKPSPPPPPPVDRMLRKPFARFAPDWDLKDCGGVKGVGYHKALNGRERVFVTHPRTAYMPCVLSKTVRVPAFGKTKLRLDVGRDPNGEWVLWVMVDGRPIKRPRVDAKSAPGGWMSLDVDLTRYAGKAIKVQLQNKAVSAETNASAYWHMIDVISE